MWSEGNQLSLLSPGGICRVLCKIILDVCQLKEAGNEKELQRIVESTEKYEVARKRAISDLRTGYHLGGIITASRKELHER